MMVPTLELLSCGNAVEPWGLVRCPGESEKEPALGSGVGQVPDPSITFHIKLESLPVRAATLVLLMLPTTTDKDS